METTSFTKKLFNVSYSQNLIQELRPMSAVWVKPEDRLGEWYKSGHLIKLQAKDMERQVHRRKTQQGLIETGARLKKQLTDTENDCHKRKKRWFDWKGDFKEKFYMYMSQLTDDLWCKSRRNLVRKYHFSLDINQLLWLLKKVISNKNQLFFKTKNNNKTKLI